jgi:hypothetical protein
MWVRKTMIRVRLFGRMRDFEDISWIVPGKCRFLSPDVSSKVIVLVAGA